MAPKFQAPAGTQDVFGTEARRVETLVGAFRELVNGAGFGLILGPMFEDLAVYERVGESTDIVRKEMYDFTDKGGRPLALRPDSTPSVVRAFVQHRPTTPWKVWYLSPHFRYDRPQRGRLRQHHTLGLEAIGVAEADLDAELIGLSWRFLTGLGFDTSTLTLLVNSIGDAECRPAYRQLLLDYLDERADQLCSDHRDRRADNPMRVLDCKKEPCRQATADAPLIPDHLCAGCAAHFDRLKQCLDAMGVPYQLDARLVRGQDYYTRTAFEITAKSLSSAQNALGGGGRYDGFVEAIGGPATPGVGFGFGIERILLACDDAGILLGDEAKLDVFVVDTASGVSTVRLVSDLRAAGLDVDRSYGDRSMKAQMRSAGKSGATLALIIGPEEAAAGTVVVKPLQGDGNDETVSSHEVIDHVRRRINHGG